MFTHRGAGQVYSAVYAYKVQGRYKLGTQKYSAGMWDTHTFKYSAVIYSLYIEVRISVKINASTSIKDRGQLCVYFNFSRTSL